MLSVVLYIFLKKFCGGDSRTNNFSPAEFVHSLRNNCVFSVFLHKKDAVACQTN